MDWKTRAGSSWGYYQDHPRAYQRFVYKVAQHTPNPDAVYADGTAYYEQETGKALTRKRNWRNEQAQQGQSQAPTSDDVLLGRGRLYT